MSCTAIAKKWMFFALVTVVLQLAAVVGVGAQIKITYLGTSSSTIAQAREELIKEFHAIQDEIRVEAISVGGDSATRDQFLVSVAGAIPPDVVLHNSTPEFAQSGVVVSLDEYIQRSPAVAARQLIPATREAHTYHGKLYAIPYNVGVNVLVAYNEQLLNEAAVSPPQDNWTWDEFLEMSRRLTMDRSGDGTVDQFGYHADNLDLEMWIATAGGRLLSQDEREVGYWFPDTEANIEAVEWLARIVREHGVSPPLLSSGLQPFIRGEAAMFGATNDQPPRFTEELDFGVVAWPQLRKRAIQVGGRALYVVNTGNSVKMEAAWTFVEWLTRKEQEIIHAQIAGRIPAYLDTLASSEYRSWLAENRPTDLEFIEEAAAYGILRPAGWLGEFDVRRGFWGQFVHSVVDDGAPSRNAIETFRTQARAYFQANPGP